MSIGAIKIMRAMGIVFSVIVLGFSAPLIMAATGSIIGFIYDKDGTTPLAGAVVQFKNLSTNRVLESSRTDQYGIFKLEGVESGVYAYGVVTEKGNFSSESFLAVKVGPNELAKMAISLKPYDKKEAEAVNGMFRELEIAGESLVGTIIGFDQYSRMAEVKITKGRIRLDDRIHVKGWVTDFYQDLKVLSKDGIASMNVLAGENAHVELKQNAQAGDLVYVVKKKELFPIVIFPVAGLAACIASSSIIQNSIQIKEEFRPASPFKN